MTLFLPVAHSSQPIKMYKPPPILKSLFLILCSPFLSSLLIQTSQKYSCQLTPSLFLLSSPALPCGFWSYHGYDMCQGHRGPGHDHGHFLVSDFCLLHLTLWVTSSFVTWWAASLQCLLITPTPFLAQECYWSPEFVLSFCVSSALTLFQVTVAALVASTST